MIYIDDFLTRTYWDENPYPHGMGTNIPKDYSSMTIEEEFKTIKYIYKDMNIKFIVFMVGCVLDSKDQQIQDCIKWLVNNDITIAGHGYYHTESEWKNGYKFTAEKTLQALKNIGQKPPYLWRYPRHESVNEEYIKSIGFNLAPYDYYLDPELLKTKKLDVLYNNEHRNAWVHSVYLTRIKNDR